MSALLWSLPHPTWQDVVLEEASDAEPASLSGDAARSGARFAFRRVRRLVELVPKGTLAEESELSGPCLSNQGETLYFTRSMSGQRADIVRSTRREGRWSLPNPVRELNSVDDDRHLTIGADGAVATLASNRSGGRGGFDIYESFQRNSRWTRPKNLGSMINTEADEFDPAISPDGLRLYFVRVASGGTADIFRSIREKISSEWQPPQPVNEVNTPQFHERSPSVTRGDVLWFASNRRISDPAATQFETTQFDLFKAPLLASPSTPKFIGDGIASDADETDSAISPSHDLLIFASKREGTRQLFESRADAVVAQLTWSWTHLDRADRFRWAVPLIMGLLLTVVWHARKPIGNAAPKTPVTKTALPISAAPKRSEPPKNPLASWPTDQKPAAASKPLVATQAVSTKAELTVPDARKSPPVRRRAGKFVAAVLLVAIGGVFWKLSSDGGSLTKAPIELNLSEFGVLRDFAPTKVTEIGTLPRTTTVRVTAPEMGIIPAEAMALRQLARWPVDRAVVRQAQPIERPVVEIADGTRPSSTGQPKSSALLRSNSLTTTPTIIERSAEPIAITAVDLASEKPNPIAPITVARATNVAGTSSIIVAQSITANSATLKFPERRTMPVEPANSLTTTTIASKLTVPRRSSVGQLSVAALSESTSVLASAVVTETPTVSRLFQSERLAENAIADRPSGLAVTTKSEPIVRQLSTFNPVYRDELTASNSGSTPQLPSRRETRLADAALVGAASEAPATAPAVLLTSAVQSIELIPFRALPLIVKTESTSSRSSINSEPFGNSMKWLARSIPPTTTLATNGESTSQMVSKPLPVIRRSTSLPISELREDIKPAD